jgi:hypothetical protein
MQENVNKKGFLGATADFALKRDDLKELFKDYLRKIDLN